MRKLTSTLTKLSNKPFFLFWLFFHLAVATFFGVVFLTNPASISVDADLMNMFPKSFEEESIRAADEKLTEATGQNVFILVANEDFSKARDVAVKVYERLEHSENMKSVSLYNDVGSLSEVLDFIYKYRWNLLDDETIELLNSEGGPETFSTNALGQIYGGFTMLPLDNIDSDPFMLAEHDLNKYLESVSSSGTAMSVKDGVLASEKDGNWYIMIRGILSKKGAALASKENGITEIYKICSDYETDGTRFVYSGTPFHSHESSNSASREIAIISTVSLIVVIVMLLIVFKSFIPLGMSVGSILISVLTAILSTLAVFHKMHILTLVFGTSLIGSCIDYSIHYFTHWAGNPELKDGKDIRNHLLPGLSMAIVSSSLCFAILLFAPFNLLKQMSLFSLSGLFSSFLTTVCVYPFIKLPSGNRQIKLHKLFKPTNNQKVKKLVGRLVITSLFVVSIGCILIFRHNFRIHNDLNSLYTMEGRLLNDEIEANQIIQYSPTGWFIVRGDTEDQALRNEEILRDMLENSTSKDIGYLSTSLFIPSIEQQKKSRAACEKLLALAEYQYEALGFDPSYAVDLRTQFASSENDFISMKNGNVPSYLVDSISSAWIGEINGKYYTVVLPNKISDAAPLRKLVENDQNAFFINKMSDMGSDLDKLTIMVLKFFAIAYLVMFVMLKFFYKWKQAFKIISIPLLIVLVAGAIFAIFDISLEFFSVTGLILVFGLGLDYIIYMMENEKPAKQGENKTLEPFAIMLSFTTTVISFGALALSSFKPVHLIGLTIFLGLSTAYVSTMFYDRSM